MILKSIQILLLSSLPLVGGAPFLRAEQPDEAYILRMRAMTSDMTEAEEEVFSAGLIELLLENYPPATGSEGLARMMFMQAAIEAAPLTMHGVTKEEIMARGADILRENKLRGISDSTAEAAERRAEAERKAEAERAEAEREAAAARLGAERVERERATEADPAAAQARSRATREIQRATE